MTENSQSNHDDLHILLQTPSSLIERFLQVYEGGRPNKMDEFSECLSKGRSPGNWDSRSKENHKGRGHHYPKQTLNQHTPIKNQETLDRGLLGPLVYFFCTPLLEHFHTFKTGIQQPSDISGYQIVHV